MSFKSPRNMIPSWRQRMDGTIGASVGTGTYIDKVLGYGPIAYWPLYETAGAAAVCLINPLQNGVYHGPTLANAIGPDGVNSAPLFDGINDYVNVHSATLAGAFSAAAGTLMVWCRVFNIGVWTDSAYRGAARLGVDNNNYSYIRKSSSAGRRQGGSYDGGGAVQTCEEVGLLTTAWFHSCMTWNTAANQLYFYHNGVATADSPKGPLGAWVGALTNGHCVIGSYNDTPIAVWYGWLAHCAVWATTLAQPQVADLAIPTG